MDERKRKTWASMTGAMSSGLPIYGMVEGVNNLAELAKTTQTYANIESFCASIPASETGASMKYVPDMIMLGLQFGTYVLGVKLIMDYFTVPVTKLSAKYLFKVNMKKPFSKKTNEWQSKKCKKI